MTALLSGSAIADVVDRPHFRLDGLVIVWAADSTSGAPVVSDMVIDSGTGSTAASSGDVDLISSDAHTVVTGSLVATQDGLASATGGMPFLLTNTTRGTFSTDTNGDGVVSGDDAFTFIADAAFSGTAGELRYEHVGGNTMIYMDVDGDGNADYAIRLDGNIDPLESNFIL